jgi:hypothetical protein
VPLACAVVQINQQCISEAVPMHTTVLESPPGHNCLTLAGAQPGGADVDSKEAEEERVSAMALRASLHKGRHSFLTNPRRYENP